jgi:ketosteroid isomerase-like protein
VAEALIRQRVEDLVKALRAKDIDSVMSLYAPNLVSFDLAPPLQYIGADNKRRAWQEAFAIFTGPFDYEVRDLTVTTHGELAFVHSLNHVSGTMANGHITDLSVRWTACFRRIDGVWLVVHDHVSVPADRTELLKPSSARCSDGDERRRASIMDEISLRNVLVSRTKRVTGEGCQIPVSAIGS